MLRDIERLLSARLGRRLVGGRQNTRHYKKRIWDSLLIQKPNGFLSITNVRHVRKYIREKRLTWITYSPLLIQRLGLRPGMSLFPDYSVRKKISKSYALNAIT